MDIIKGQYNFKKDICTGTIGEDEIINYMKNLGYDFIEKNHDYKYDLKMLYNKTNKIYTYEIKTDVYPKDTGNIVIEFESRNKPSGIAATEADYFVTYFKHFGEIWNISTNKLKLMIFYLNPIIYENSGDLGSNTKLYCFKKKEVSEYFKIHKI